MVFIIWNKRIVTGDIYAKPWIHPTEKCLESTKSDSDFFGVFKVVKGAGSLTAQLQKMIKYK